MCIRDRIPYGKLRAAPALAEGGILPKFDAVLQPVNGNPLEMANGHQRVIEGLEEFSETSQFKGFTYSFRYRREYHFTTVVTFGVALGSQESSETSAGHIFQVS